MALAALGDFWSSVISFLGDVYDDYYLGWVLAPLLITIILPMLILVIIYVDIMIVLIYTWHWGKFRAAYGKGMRNGALYAISAIWDVHSRLWHGYEVVGLEKIPKDDAALLVLYHGAIPVDYYYLLGNVYLHKSRLISTIADNFLFKLPGFPAMASALNIVPGSVTECANALKSGALMAIFPGGVFEAQFGDSDYKLLWRNRLGFAKVALEAKVPIIPIFTQNIREAFVAFPFGRSLCMKLYSWTRMPIVPVLGEFPVKLRTYVGDPIPYEPITPEELKIKVIKAMDGLILKHQKLPGSIFRALVERARSSKMVT